MIRLMKSLRDWLHHTLQTRLFQGHSATAVQSLTAASVISVQSRAKQLTSADSPLATSFYCSPKHNLTCALLSISDSIVLGSPPLEWKSSLIDLRTEYWHHFIHRLIVCRLVGRCSVSTSLLTECSSLVLSKASITVLWDILLESWLRIIWRTTFYLHDFVAAWC